MINVFSQRMFRTSSVTWSFSIFNLDFVVTYYPVSQNYTFSVSQSLLTLRCTTELNYQVRRISPIRFAHLTDTTSAFLSSDLNTAFNGPPITLINDSGASGSALNRPDFTTAFNISASGQVSAQPTRRTVTLELQSHFGSHVSHSLESF